MGREGIRTLSIAAFAIGAAGFLLSVLLAIWRSQAARARRMAALATYLRPHLFAARDLFNGPLLDREDLRRAWRPTQYRLEELVEHIPDAELRDRVNRLLNQGRVLADKVAPGSLAELDEEAKNQYQAGFRGCEEEAKHAASHLYKLEIEAVAARG